MEALTNACPNRTNLIENGDIISGMAVIHISEADSARSVAVARTMEPPRRSIVECIERLPGDSVATIDKAFAHDVG